MIIDVAGLQNPDYVGRGIGRYIQSLIGAAVTANLPITALAFDPGRSPPMVEDGIADRLRMLPYGPAVLAECEDEPKPFLVLSPFEPKPHWAIGHFGRRAPRSHGRLGVLAYDLIPQLFPEIYLTTVRAQRQYRNGLEAIWAADRLCAISSCSARDVEQAFGLSAGAVAAVGTGSTPFFHPARSALEEATDKQVMERLRGGRAFKSYVMAVTGTHFTKNLRGLIAAYASLPQETQRKVDLVLVGKVMRADLDALIDGIRKAGGDPAPDLARSIQVLSKLSDYELRALYRNAKLSVMASIYEGFGLPAAEAVSCGTATLVSSTSSLPEVLPVPDAQFDPTSPAALAAKMSNLLNDPTLLSAFKAKMPITGQRSWADVATLTWRHMLAESGDIVGPASPAARPARNGKAKPSLALVGPLPPVGGGIGEYNYMISPSFSERFEVTFFATTPTWLAHTDPSKSMNVAPISTLPEMAANFSHIVYTFGNSEHHLPTFDMLRRFPGTVWLHDIRLWGFMYSRSKALSSDEPWHALADYARTWYGPEIASALLLNKSIDYLKNLRLTFARELARHARGLIVHSLHAQRLLDADMGPQAGALRRLVVPLAIPPNTGRHRPLPTADADRPLVIGTIGYQDPIRMTDVVLRAAMLASQHQPIHFKVVGLCSAGYEQDLRNIVGAHPNFALTFTGFLPGRAYHEAIAGLDLAVQMRRVSNGESSATIADCLRLGVPVVTNMESAHEWWGSALTRAYASESADELAERIRQALVMPGRLNHVAAAATLCERDSPSAIADSIGTWLTSA